MPTSLKKKRKKKEKRKKLLPLKLQYKRCRQRVPSLWFILDSGDDDDDRILQIAHLSNTEREQRVIRHGGLAQQSNNQQTKSD